MPAKPDATAIVVPVPAADPAVEAWRRRFDPSCPQGVPAHVTLLYPWLAPGALDDAAISALAAVLAGHAPFSFGLRRVARRDGLTFLPPEPAAPFRALSRAIVARWPACLPYRGRYGPEVEPHLSIGYGEQGPSEADHRVIAADVGPRLPVRASAGQVAVLIRRDDRWSWGPVLALGGAG